VCPSELVTEWTIPTSGDGGLFLRVRIRPVEAVRLIPARMGWALRGTARTFVRFLWQLVWPR
jgi:hypothetical protein